MLPVSRKAIVFVYMLSMMYVQSLTTEREISDKIADLLLYNIPGSHRSWGSICWYKSILYSLRINTSHQDRQIQIHHQ